MKSTCRNIGWLFALLSMGFFFHVRAQIPADLSGELRRLQSRMEQMAHGYITEAEWESLVGDIGVLRTVARDSGQVQLELDAGLLLSRVYGELRREWPAALDLLRSIREESRLRPVTGMNRVYLAEAAILARLGDREGLSALIEEFRSGPYFDPQTYNWSGGEGRQTPLAVTRPNARGSDSITITAMERYRREADFAVGSRLPPAELMDEQGRLWSTGDLGGRVVVLDFWLEGAQASETTRLYLERLAGRYGKNLLILGICLNRSGSSPGRAPGRIGTQIPREKAAQWLRSLAVYGDAQTLVLDREGRLAARVRDGISLEKEVDRLFGQGR
ncbi:MAG: hypothetical protein U1E27_10555 [Kiritimatiellia bacterium]|nr:hypothetical protein [Kiritimatiellia bacterium]